MKQQTEIVIPADAVELSHIQPGERIAIHVGENTLVVIPEKLTALQAANTIAHLTRVGADLLSIVKNACGTCEERREQGLCPSGHLEDPERCPLKSMNGHGVTVDDTAREEAGIPLDAKLEVFVDEGEMLVTAADYEHDITDVPSEPENMEFKIHADRSLLAQFLYQTYSEHLESQGMFSAKHCGESHQDYTGKVLILRPSVLADNCRDVKNQLWYGQSGFGLSPTSSGRAVFATCLGDEEKARWNRTDFIGVLDEQYLPDWAQEKLTELRAPAQQQEEPVQEQDSGPAQGGMEMR